MEHSMFCFQCEQTTGYSGCMGKAGVCGKTAATARTQDELTETLIGLTRTSEGKDRSPEADRLVVRGLFAILTNVSFDDSALNEFLTEAGRLKHSLSPMCGLCAVDCNRTEDFDMNKLRLKDEDMHSLKSLILSGVRGMAAYAYHTMVLGHEDRGVVDCFYKGLSAVGYDSYTVQDLLPIVMKLGAVDLDCIALLNRANRQAFGVPASVQVSFIVEQGPFIVTSDHDLRGLKLLLGQTQGRGINTHIHGEISPTHACPELRKYSHLKSNFGTAWQNQRKEFSDFPAPVLSTTNCLISLKPSYFGRVFAIALASHPGIIHTDGHKDFSPVTQKALELGSFKEDVTIPGINDGTRVTTGFGRKATLATTGIVAQAVRQNRLHHILLVGGCDRARSGRNCHTGFVKQAPEDILILTLAYGKYRFNDLELGTLADIPRLLDMEQYNNAFGAIQMVATLAEAFGYQVSSPPPTLVLSWYEQKVVCILLNLLHLGIRNIYFGPTPPAFLSPIVLEYLTEQFKIHPISTPEHDLVAILA